jgi:hypothetical protein
MNVWLLQVAGFVALVIDVFLGGVLVHTYLGTLVAALFALALIGAYLGLILGPLAADTYHEPN